MKKSFWALIVLIASIALGAWLSRQSPDEVHVRTSETVAIPLAEFRELDLDPRPSATGPRLNMAVAAALAANVYQPEGSDDLSCSPEVPGRIPLEGWDRLGGWSESAPCLGDVTGMHYEVWGTMDEDGMLLVAIVFRGTVPSILAHWCANLRDLRLPMCDPTSDQYLHVAPLVDQVLTGVYDEWGPDHRAVLVGHSLGGGLAELGGRSSYITEVVSFDGSPVTAKELAAIAEAAEFGDEDALEWNDEYEQVSGCEAAFNNPPDSERLTVRRVFEHGEVLAYLRLVRRWFGGLSQAAPRIVEYRTNVLTGNLIAQHSMKALACELGRHDQAPLH